MVTSTAVGEGEEEKEEESVKEEEENKLEDCGQHFEAEEGALQKQRQIYEVHKRKIFTKQKRATNGCLNLTKRNIWLL